MNLLTQIYIAMFFFGIFFIVIFIITHRRYYKLLYKSPPLTKCPYVSFLVPAYNEEKSLEDTINSLIEIEYPKDKKEIIIINDGSKDNTLKIAKSLAKKYHQIKVLDKDNSGKADSLNKAIKIARGELIAVTDADSAPEKDSLIKMIGHFEEKRVAAVTSRVLVKNKENWLEKFQVLDYSIIAWTRKLLDFVNSVYVTNGPLSIYRKDIVKNIGGLQTVHKYWKTMFKKGAFGYFVIPYVSASFILAIIGFLLLSRYIWVKGSYQIVSLYYSFSGYNILKYLDFSISLTLLLILGLSFFILAIIYYKIGFINSQTGNKSVPAILAYSFFYRSLYVIPLLIAIYKLLKGDIR